MKKKRIQVKQNSSLLGIIIILIIIFIAIIYFLSQGNKQNEEVSNEEDIKKCNFDSDCVPASCCHAESCINENYKSNCYEVACTLECSGPLDCGAGYCACLNNKCRVISKNEIYE